MPLILPANTLSAAAYSVANSCRFNRPDSALMDKTLGTPTSQQKFTFSFWCKRGLLTTNMYACGWGNSSSTYGYLNAFNASDKFDGYADDGAGNLMTNRLFRDCSAWYHIVLAVDTTQGTAANRQNVYVNGVKETSFAEENYFDEDYSVLGLASGQVMCVGDYTGGNNHFDGYLAEFYFIDGTQYAASDFGEFDEDSPTIWKPKDVSGLTFGNNGFYLDFEDSANLGNDANGGTDLSETNVAAVDQSTDTPTNNFCTMNPLDNYYQSATFSEGNCKVVTSSSVYAWSTATIGLSTGLWYFETKVDQTPSGNNIIIGIATGQPSATGPELGDSANDYGYYGYAGDTRNNNAVTSYGDTFTVGDIIGTYIDLNANKLYFAKNGVVQNSGTGVSITAVATTKNGLYFPSMCQYHGSSTSATFSVNFGNPSYTGTDKDDVNGYGSFEYDPSVGTFDSASKDFLAICTKNLGSDGG